MCSTARQRLADDKDAADLAYRFCVNYLRCRLTGGPVVDMVIREAAELVSGLVGDTVAPDHTVCVEINLHRSHIQVAVAAENQDSVHPSAEVASVSDCYAISSSSGHTVEADAPTFVMLPVPRSATGAMSCNVSALL